MNPTPEGSGAFAMHDANLIDAVLTTGFKVIRHQCPHVLWLKGVEVQRAIDGHVDRIFVWFHSDKSVKGEGSAWREGLLLLHYTDLTEGSSMAKVRLGLIGAGWFASRRHCPDIVDHVDAELTALCRRNPEQLRTMANAFGNPACFTDYRELLDSGLVDGVVICSPHHLHFEHAEAALQRDLPVLLEKPITIEPKKGLALARMARERQLPLVVAQNPPYWSHCHFLRQQFRSGCMGELESASLSFVGNSQGVFGAEPIPDDIPGVVKPTLFRSELEQNGGGSLIDGGTHYLCELLWCTDLRVGEVTAQTNDSALESRTSMTLTLENGAMATFLFVSNSRIYTKRQHGQYYGSRATALVRGVPFAVTVTAGDTSTTVGEADLPPAPTPVGDLVGAIQHRNAVAMDAETAVHVVEIVQAAYRSARDGSRVQL